jgi:proteasome lid subunit RPN8/RPN11
VGWYHSHPGLGVFLSEQDRFIHKSFFGDEPWYIAVVFDPASGERGVFVWAGEDIVSYTCSSANLPTLERGHPR